MSVELVKLVPDDKALSLVLETSDGKYKYNCKIHDSEEMGYLTDRFQAFSKQGTLKKYLADECVIL